MPSFTSYNKLTRGKCQRVPQNLDYPKNGQTLKQVEHLATYPNRCCVTITIIGWLATDCRQADDLM